MKKVLIVDDEPFIRELMVQSLEELEDRGLEILVAKDGHDALEQIEREAPGLVFLDVMMPKMNGFEVCQRIKKDPKRSNTYVIILTAKGQLVDKQKGKEVGADEYMTKPFDPDVIIERVRAVLAIPL
ncbi:MAG: response regulator transcription factor [Planctomycetota bacterium]|jgi:DNA-binding response OmpR family regulator